MLRDLLAGEGIIVGRLHVATLMKRMGIEAIYRKPNTSKPAPGHKIYPYLLRKLPVTRPNQVWAMDITYIPMARGFVHLAAVVDWFSRRVLTWRLSITLHADFCIEAVEEALARFGPPEIFNTDQGSQFTSIDFTKVLLASDIKISMDGKGAWRDNVFVERLWKSIKYDRPVPRLLQRKTPTFEPGPENSGPRLLQSTASRSGIKPGRRSTYQAVEPVQTNRATSMYPEIVSAAMMRAVSSE